MLAPVLHRPCPNDPQTLVEVEQAIAAGTRTLRFADELERRYQAETREQRRQFLTSVGICGALVYNIFLISDWLSLNDVFSYVAVGRLCLITPLFIFLLILTQRVSSRWAMETAAAAGSVLSSLVPLVVMIYSDSPHRLHNLQGMLLIMVFGTMIQQLPLRYAAVAIGSMLTILLVTTYLANFADFMIWQANALLFGSTAGLLLMASYFLERGSRLSYLFALRGRLLEVRLTEIARTDPLTQLFNRRYQDEIMASIWERAAHNPTRIALIMLDIDHFKSYNDSYGHPQGDTCLILLSRMIQRSTRDAEALVFRFGGEEILILLLNADASQAHQLAETLRTDVMALAVPHPVMGDGACVTISLGVAAATAPGTSADALITAADTALYAAKHAGRNSVRATDQPLSTGVCGSMS